MKMNEKFYNFDVDKCEIFQYTIYKETGDHYNWHVDSDQVTDTLLRKISVSVQLSDPSEYEGSDLEIHNTKLYSYLFLFILYQKINQSQNLRREFLIINL